MENAAVNLDQLGTEQGANPAFPDCQGFIMLRGLILPLTQKEDFIIGRDKSRCDLVLAHEHISKQHSIISYRSGRFFIKDLGSLNGTYVNGERVNGLAPLVAGDEIRMPPYMMLFFGPDQPDVIRKAPARPPASSGLKTEPGRQKGAITGLLSILSVTDMIQLVNFTTQSGFMTVRTPDLDIAELVFLEGEIVQARFDGKTGAEAVYAVLGVRSGEFEFVQGNPPAARDPIKDKTVTLLLEGSRLMDEGNVSGNLNTV